MGWLHVVSVHCAGIVCDERRYSERSASSHCDCDVSQCTVDTMDIADDAQRTSTQLQSHSASAVAGFSRYKRVCDQPRSALLFRSEWLVHH